MLAPLGPAGWLTELFRDRFGRWVRLGRAEQREGWFRETTDDRVMEKVDAEGNVIGFSVLRVSSLGGAPLEVTL